jgi:hypothetical protein
LHFLCLTLDGELIRPLSVTTAKGLTCKLCIPSLLCASRGRPDVAFLPWAQSQILDVFSTSRTYLHLGSKNGLTRVRGWISDSRKDIKVE